ncbi:transglutaminase domain-containing protein [Clostridium thermarum]|uniref:transglutaminase domain-containing protein n=1 Tax=Clostridium thermarum TaxID=1716543 RepID=UPI0013D2CC55|nr:transglutaminase domain-containing protein [Clostridium thermarum]
MTINKRFRYLVLSMIVLLILSGCTNVNTNKGLKITKWDNFYDGNNIHFYYEDFNNTNIQELNSSYKLNEKIGNSGDELERSLKIVEWMKSLMEYNKGSIGTKEDALSILKEVETTKKASDREFSIVFSQASTAIGIYARRGEFRLKEASTINGEDYYKVNEIWSDKFNKWIMIDPSTGVYIQKDNVPLSAMELVQNGLKNVEAVGVKESKKYIEKLEKLLYSYSIPIDNGVYGRKRSNTYITYLKKGEVPTLKMSQGFVVPSIYVNNDNLFNISPKIVYTDDKSDTIPTLVIMKKSAEGTITDDKTFVVGVFINSVMLESYQLKINEEPWKKIDMYTDFVLNEGVNTISLSLNGSDILRQIVIEY